jgi:hypothetical protein
MISYNPIPIPKHIIGIGIIHIGIAYYRSNPSVGYIIRKEMKIMVLMAKALRGTNYQT